MSLSRDVFDAIHYMAATGCQRRMLPYDFPPVSTGRDSFYDWRDNGLPRGMNHHLVMAAREAAGRWTARVAETSSRRAANASTRVSEGHPEPPRTHRNTQVTQQNDFIGQDSIYNDRTRLNFMRMIVNIIL